MSKYDKQRAKIRRKMLLRILGPVCARCHTTEDLTFDCITPQGDEHHSKDTASRMRFYFRQFHRDNVQVLCQKCNSWKGDLTIDFRDLFSKKNPNPF